MMNNSNAEISRYLKELEEKDNLRLLNTLRCDGKYIWSGNKRYVNLSSNDYLGLSDIGLQQEFLHNMMSRNCSDDCSSFLMSNPSSRLITGNSPEYDLLEGTLSKLYGNKSASVLSSGYLINSGVLPAVTAKGDLIIGDKLLHASIIDGLKLCEADWTRFRHNDMEHLRAILKKDRSRYRNVWIATESLFSMDGDLAPLKELIELKKEYDLHIYLDEAHAFGVYGTDGAGYASECGLLDHIDILVATMGKALSSCGAFVISDNPTRQLLINKMRTLIFSTALPPINLLWSNYLVERLTEFEPRREHLRKLIETLATTSEASHIIPIMAHENSRAMQMSRQMREAGFWATPVRYPTVPQGKARIRISLSAALDIDDIQKFASLCKTIG